VSVFGREHHHLDGGHFCGRELARAGVIELRNRIEALLAILIERLTGDDRAQDTPLPGRYHGARDRNVPDRLANHRGRIE
jgi:uncharacterized small protein (DUF1192 family)